MDVRFCPRCGTERLAEARFCSACGFPYDALERTEAAVGGVAPAIAQDPTPADGPAVEARLTEPVWSDEDLIRAIHASEGGTRRAASVYFASVGMLLVSAAAVSTALGVPRPASAFSPLRSLEDLIARPADSIALTVALGAAVVGLVVAQRFASRTIRLATAVVILLVAGFIAGGVAIGLAGRIAYDVAGAILPGPILLISGAAAILSAALMAAVIRD